MIVYNHTDQIADNVSLVEKADDAHKFADGNDKLLIFTVLKSFIEFAMQRQQKANICYWNNNNTTKVAHLFTYSPSQKDYRNVKDEEFPLWLN